MDNLIKKLQGDKQYPFGQLSKEEQKCLEKAGNENCEYYDGENGWINKEIRTFYFYTSYRIKSTYQPEPEFEDIEIVENVRNSRITLGIWRNNEWISLHEIPDMPNFECFFRFYTDSRENQTEYIIFENVSKEIHSGIKVFARLRK